MFYLINHNSYLIFGAILWVTVSTIAIKKMSSPWNYIIAGVLALILVGVFSLVRPKEASTSEGNYIHNKIGGGEFVLLEFQSPY